MKETLDLLVAKSTMKTWINTNLGRYYLVAESEKHLFYVNYNECDENAQVKMFDKNMDLISDNYFAYSHFLTCVENKELIRQSKRMQQLSKKYLQSLN